MRPEGARQGSLGNCWFIAAASAVAEYPNRIKNVFMNSGLTRSGIMRFQMFFKGKKEIFNIDDRLPADSRKRLVLAKKSQYGGAYWLPLLEKAYAKFNTNYIRLQGGQPQQAMRQLTGMPSYEF